MPYFDYNNKKVYYNVYGKGTPLMLLHGNAASSFMFITEKNYYARYFQVIIIDFPGHGKSYRFDVFPDNIWHYNSLVVIELCRVLNIDKVMLMGTSGGAIVALYTALEKPTLISKIVADSFPGESLTEEIMSMLINSRKKQSFISKIFLRLMHGTDWKNVIEADTKYVKEFYNRKRNFFENKLPTIESPVLLTGSIKDELLSGLEISLNDISHKIKNSKLILFNCGKHPTMLSRRRLFRKYVIDFLFDKMD